MKRANSISNFAHKSSLSKVSFALSILLAAACTTAPTTQISVSDTGATRKIASDTIEQNTLDALTAAQALRIQQITSVFENSTIDFQYDYVENLHDGRGYTAGRVGFCTGTGDLVLVVERYTQKQSQNVLANYLPELQRLTSLNGGSGSEKTSGLPGFVKSWKEAAKDPLFRQAQDEITYDLYFAPALKHADEYGLQLPISKGFVYDTIIQHGDGQDLDSVNALMHRASEIAGGSPKDGIDEKIWLQALIDARKIDLTHPANETTQKEWADSVDRVWAYDRIFHSKAVNLDRSFVLQVFEHTFRIP